VLYAERKPRDVVSMAGSSSPVLPVDSGASNASLNIYSAYYGIGPYVGECIDVTERLRSLVKDSSLDIIVNNSTLAPNQNPFRGKKKHLMICYSYGKGGDVSRKVDEKDWLIIGQVQEREVVNGVNPLAAQESSKYNLPAVTEGRYCPFCGQHVEVINGRFKVHAKSVDAELREVNPQSCEGSSWDYEGHELIRKTEPLSAPALNDYLIRKFSVSPQRLRGPMPIELRDFHRNDLAQLFAELGFKRGAEIGVAEGNYSEVLLKANPECELLLVDPWHAYSGNPQGKSDQKHSFAWNETKRKITPYSNARMIEQMSMDAVRTVSENRLDFVYIDGNHSFDFVMQDLIEWSKRVRSGGIVSGDDYYELDQKRWIGGGVVDAVQAYVKAHRIPIWYIFAGHKSTDYLWVKP